MSYFDVDRYYCRDCLGTRCHLVLLVGLPLFITYAQLVRRLCLLNHHHFEASSRQPLSVVVVILLREAAMGLFTLQ